LTSYNIFFEKEEKKKHKNPDKIFCFKKKEKKNKIITKIKKKNKI